MTPTVADIEKMMESIAPRGLAEKWDNVGMQVGNGSWPVKRIMVALDPCLNVVEQACKNEVSLLITHHPLIFSPLKQIDTCQWQGRVIELALRHQMAIFTAHTNFDSADGGLNDQLSRKLGLCDTKPLDPAAEADQTVGIGRLGRLPSAAALSSVAAMIKTEIGLSHVRVVGNRQRMISKVALCTGSGGGLMPQFLASDAEVYISGDLRYHDARDAEAYGRALIDIGHFGSEHLMVANLVERLAALPALRRHPVTVLASDVETDPFTTL